MDIVTNTVGWFLPLIFLLMAVFLVILYLWALAEVLIYNFRGNNGKIAWLLTVILVPFFGVLFYFIFGRKQRAERI
jgi:hypothetical protein